MTHAAHQTRSTLNWISLSALISGVFASLPLAGLMFLPGFAFGVCFARASLPPGRGRIVFTIGSGLSYLAARQIFLAVADTPLPTPAREFTAAGLAGLFGALALAGFIRHVTRTPPDWRAEARTTALGAAAGMLFFLVVALGIAAVWLAWPLAYGVWQLPVALSLAAGLQPPVPAEAAPLAGGPD